MAATYAELIQLRKHMGEHKSDVDFIQFQGAKQLIADGCMIVDESGHYMPTRKGLRLLREDKLI